MKMLTDLFFILYFALPLIAQDHMPSNSIEDLINKREYNKAHDILTKQYTENDEDPQTNYWLAVLAIRDTLYNDAIDYLDVAIEGDENNAEYYFMLGRAYAVKAQNSGAFTGAFAAPKIKSNWLKTLELDPEHIEAKWGLFQFYINAPGIVGGDDEEAKILADDLVNSDPARGYNMLATYYSFVDENMVEADKALTKSMTYQSDEETNRIIRNSTTNLLNQLGYRFLGKEDFKNSYKYFKWAIKIRPDYENPYDSMGDYFSAIAQFDSALIYYEKALKIRPDFTVSKYNKSLMLEKLGKKDQAIAVYREIIEQNPENNYADLAKERLEELGN
jgi:tetratricopeptide (TPR) repeat protein